MSRKRKARVVHQERLANRQAIERLRRAYDKLYSEARPEKNDPVTNQEKSQRVQEKTK